MNNFIIRQLSINGGSINKEGSLWVHDFCKSKTWGTSNPWLENNKGSGWNIDNKYNVYTNFKLELIK